MPIIEIIFYLFATVMTAAAVMVISVRNPVYAALFLVLTFFSASAIWLLLEAEFLAIILILVYVGAVMVLFLFVVMMLDINLSPLKEGFIRYLPVAVMVAVVMAIEILMVLWARGRFGEEQWPIPGAQPESYNNTREIGESLFTNFVLPFEVAGVILLVAIIAAVALTHRRRPEAKRQDPARQVQVTPQERVRIVKMESESRKGR
ncbi:MAG TPA: NADH-quinone oxidoreductase subunit J [Xanthomonadales bacterium]|nr:NADH-quinone oxidoreductase subunit J [Xanthomonadales bacterium]